MEPAPGAGGVCVSSSPSAATPIRVRDIMSRYVVSVTEDTPVIEVARILAERRFSGLPVLDEAGGVVGMVSDFDLLARDGDTAGEVMSPDVVTVAIAAKPGFHVNELRSSWDRVALVTACSVNTAEALRRARQGIDAITVKMLPCSA